MYSYVCRACNQKFLTDIVNRSKCLVCGSSQVQKVGKEKSATQPAQPAAKKTQAVKKG